MIDMFFELWHFIERNSDGITVMAVLLGGGWALFQFYMHNRNQKLNTELTKSPDFYFTSPRDCNRFGVGYCGSGDFLPKITKDCDGNQIFHIFSMVNCGIFPAFDVKVAIICEHEFNDISLLPDDRWSNHSYWGGMPQISTFGQNGDLIPIYLYENQLHLQDKDSSLFVALEFKSNYSNTTYRRVYEWCIKKEPEEKNNSESKQDTKIISTAFGRVFYFHSVRTYAASSRRIGAVRRLWRHILKKGNNIKTLSLDEWVKNI